jgi:hypothetical protein
MEELEGSDEPITLRRAGALAGLDPHTLQVAARDGRLKASMPGNDYLTTRRHLHTYLMGRRRGAVKPLPEGYQTPEGAAKIK